MFAAGIASITAQDVDDSWVNAEAALDIPSFARRAVVMAYMQTLTTDSAAIYWRTDGQTNATGHNLLIWGTAANDSPTNTTQVITASNQLIELKCSASDTDAVNINTEGWYFPRGM